MPNDNTEIIAEKLKNLSFVKYHFTDLQGNLREVTLHKSNVNARLKGASSVDGSSVFGKIIPPTESDMVLIPDWETLQKIPWMPETGRVLCNIFYPPSEEGGALRPFEGDGRHVLKQVTSKIHGAIKDFLLENNEQPVAFFAPEVEFVVVDDTYNPLDLPGDNDFTNNHYFVPPRAKTDRAMKNIMRFLTAMAVKKEKFHTEVSSHQLEFGISHDAALTVADAAVTLKYVIKHTAQQHDLRASFIPKFNSQVNGSGMHCHQNLALVKGEESTNLFYDREQVNGLSLIGQRYIAGLLKYAREITGITNPMPVSYKRLVPGKEAPTYVSFDWANRTALCRGFGANTKKIRVEYRSPDPSANPYLAFAAMLAAGLSGIIESLPLEQLEQNDKINFYHANNVPRLPDNLGQALELMNGSKMLRSMMGDSIIDHLYIVGISEWSDYCQQISDVDIKRYF